MRRWPVEQLEHTHLYVKCLLSHVGTVLTKNSYNSNVKGQWLQIIILNIKMMKILRYCDNYQNVTQRHKVSKYCLEKMMLIDFLDAELLKIFNL